MGKLVLMVVDVIKSLASMCIMFLLRSSGQRSSSALIIYTSSIIAKNARFDFCIRL